MSYFSEVLIISNQELDEKIQSLLNKVEENSALKQPDKVVTKGNSTLRYYKRVRYNYMGEAEVKLEHLLMHEDKSHYRFLRVGDGLDDLTDKGQNADFNSVIESKITFDEE